MVVYSAGRSSGPVLRSVSSTSFNRHSSSAVSTTRRPAYNHNFFYVDQAGPSNRSVSVSSRVENPPAHSVAPKRTCMCSPTNHPGSFRCSLHKSGSRSENNPNRVSNHSRAVSCGGSSGLNMRRSAMNNSLIRIGTVEGEMVKRALAALIRPSSHHQRRRGEFQPRPSRLSRMCKA